MMFTYMLSHHLHRHKRRWLITACALILIAIIVRLMLKSDLHSLNVWDYFVFASAQQFCSLILIPSLFLFLCADAIAGDVEECFVEYALTRAKTRMSWLTAKVGVIFVHAFLFSLLCLVLFLLVGRLYGLEFATKWSEASFMEWGNPLAVAVMVFLLYVLTLTSYGTLIAMIALFVRSIAITWVLGTLLAVGSYMTWHFLTLRQLFIWMPTAQIMLLPHIPNKLTGAMNGFTLQWSIIYDVILFMLVLLAGMLQFRRCNLTKSS